MRLTSANEPTYQWYENREERLRAEEMRGLSFTDRAAAFARREKYRVRRGRLR
jgi:hypothetical protein